MNRAIASSLMAAILCTLGIAANGVPVTGTDEPVTLEDIVGTATMVTVVLKDSGARDPNLRLVEVTSGRLVFSAQNGETIPYLQEAVDAIEVQEGAVEPRRAPLLDAHVLRAEHQRIVERAWARIRDIYEASSANQEQKIRAATLLTLNDDSGAHDYLRQLAESNDIVLQLRAAFALYLVGDSVSESLLRQGLESGNRNARAVAAALTGLTGYEEGVPFLMKMFSDRAVQMSAPAARALARIGKTDIVPRLLAMVEELHDDKGEAAIFALSIMADEEVIDRIRFRLLEVDGISRYRLVRILHNIGDPMGTQELKRIYSVYPTLTPEVALILASQGDWDATHFLRNRLTRREDPTEANLKYRTRNAKALLEGGDPSAMAVFQDLLRSDEDSIVDAVFKAMTQVGSPRLITLLQPAIENVDEHLALGACETVIAIALPHFRERLLLYQGEVND